MSQFVVFIQNIDHLTLLRLGMSPSDPSLNRVKYSLFPSCDGVVIIATIGTTSITTHEF